MAHIPQGAKWYVAELIEEILVQDSPNTVHRNFVLINAGSPDDAYQKALGLGTDSEISYENPGGKLVSTRFWGLGDLQVIYDELEHGAELMYIEEMGVSAERLAALARPKEHLAVFKEDPASPKIPDYSSGEVMSDAHTLLQEDPQE